MPADSTKKPRKRKSKTKPNNKRQIKQVPHDLSHIILKDIKANFPEVLKQTMGLVTLACEKAGIVRSTYYKWRKEDPAFAAICDEVPDRVGDLVESKLYEKIQKGDGETIRFYCKTKLKHRGYTNSMELTGAGGGNLNLNVHDADTTKLSKLTNEQLESWIQLQKILNDESITSG